MQGSYFSKTNCTNVTKCSHTNTNPCNPYLLELAIKANQCTLSPKEKDLNLRSSFSSVYDCYFATIVLSVHLFMTSFNTLYVICSANGFQTLSASLPLNVFQYGKTSLSLLLSFCRSLQIVFFICLSFSSSFLFLEFSLLLSSCNSFCTAKSMFLL